MPDANVPSILNGDFEIAGAGGADVFAGWTETAGSGSVVDTEDDGNHICALTAGATANTKVTNTSAVVPGMGYIIQFKAAGDGTYSGRYAIYDVTNSAYIVGVTDTYVPGLTFITRRIPFTAPAACVSVRIELYCPTTDTGAAYFDDVVISIGAALYTKGVILRVA